MENDTDHVKKESNDVTHEQQMKKNLESQGQTAKRVCNVIGELIIVYGIIRLIGYFINTKVFIMDDFILTIVAYGCVIAAGAGVKKLGEWMQKVANEPNDTIK